jgi:hypothetical protein
MPTTATQVATQDSGAAAILISPAEICGVKVGRALIIWQAPTPGHQ